MKKPEGKDFYRDLARKVLRCRDITLEQRQSFKNQVFALMYGKQKPFIVAGKDQ